VRRRWFRELLVEQEIELDSGELEFQPAPDAIVPEKKRKPGHMTEF
jgi:hypothetical protein